MERAKKQTFYLLLLVLAMAIFFRFWHLTEIPPGLYPDVAINGNDAISALKTGNFRVFYPENNGREGLFINLIALSFALFGISIWSIKVVPATIGTLTVLGLYLLTKEIFNKQKGELIALLSAFFLAISFWHVNLSRIGFRAIMVPFFLVWSFYFLFKGLNKIENCKLKIVNWLLAGLFFGLGFHTYIAFRVAPLILVPILIIEIIRYWPIFKSKINPVFNTGQKSKIIDLVKQVYLKDGWWRWDIFFITIIIVALPIGLYFYQHPGDFITRATGISIFATENPLKELGLSTIKTLGMFNFWGDCNWRHNYACSPMLLWPIGILFLIGFFLTLKEIFKKENYQEKKYFLILTSYFILTWFFVMLLPAILTVEGLPHALRSIGVIPVVYIFAGIGGWWLYSNLKLKIQNLKLLLITCFLFLLTLAYIQFDKYFIDWANHPDVKGAFSTNFVNIGHYLNSLPKQTQKYLIVNEPGVPVPYPDGIPMPAQTIMFIAHKTCNLKPETCITYLKPEQLDKFQVSSFKFQVIVPMKYERSLFNQLREKFPDGKIKAGDGFWAFQINF